MPNTYTQIHIQLVFAVKFREGLISNTWKERLHQYMTGIVQKDNHKMVQINSVPDHLHMLIGLRPHQALSALVQKVKAESTKWIMSGKLCNGRFAWQEGFGAFSYSRDEVDNVIRYIQNQEIHHAKRSFLEEFKELLIQNNIEFESKYLCIDPQ